MELTEMTVEACREFLGKHTLGHLACIGEKYPYVVPVHYAYETRRIFIFSMPGLKTDYLRKRPYAGLQVEELQTDIGPAFLYRAVVRNCPIRQNGTMNVFMHGRC